MPHGGHSRARPSAVLNHTAVGEPHDTHGGSSRRWAERSARGWSSTPTNLTDCAGRIVAPLLAVIGLCVGIVTVFARPRRAPIWLGPSVAATVVVLVTSDPWASIALVDDELAPLRDPLLFLLLAVPLAVALDGLGVFESLAATVDGGRRLVGGLWLLATGVVIVFNLDAAVVLLTPLYVRIARRHGLAAEALAFQPALLACLASGPLPVSNLTNLIVAERFELGVVDFLRSMTLPTIAAVSVGYVAYRRAFALDTGATPIDDPVDRRALVRGLPIVGVVLIGFTLGDAFGIPAWVVALVALVWAASLDRSLPWRHVPVGAALLAAALAVLVSRAAPHVRLDELLDHPGTAGDAMALGFGVVASDATNNLPAVLAGAGAVSSEEQVWPLVVGVNMGPVLVITGSLSGLLWRDTTMRLGVPISARRYSEVGVRVGLPALLSATIVVLLT